MELLVEAGLTPPEALAAATSVPARAFGLEDRGRIAKGRRADLLLVRGDPTADITATRDIVAVWKQGVEADRAGYLAAREAERQAAEAQTTAPPPPGSESGLISDFDDGTAATSFGLGWSASSDSIMGGKSAVRIRVVAGGAEGSGWALEIEGDVAPAPVAWAGAMLVPGDAPMGPANLSHKTAIAFWVKGDGGSYQLMVYTQSGGYIPKTEGFEAGAEWKKVTLPLTVFGSAGQDLTGLLFGVYSWPGHFRFLIDSVRLE
jgi:hypothetical protein